MALTGMLAPLHDGPHNDVGALTLSDYFLLLIVLAVLVGVGVLLYKLVQRRRQE